VDGDGVVLEEDGTIDEIQIHSSCLMTGYLNNENATLDALTADGWIRSGDLGYFKEGKWYVADRTKDLIKVRGWQVSLAEIECALLKHPGITDAAVVGIRASYNSSERPEAFVVRKTGSTVNEKDIKSFLNDRLVKYKGVEKVKFVDIIPRDPTGKILRRVLQEAVQNVRPVSPVNEDAAMAYSIALRKLGEFRQNLGFGSRRRTRSLVNMSTVTVSSSSMPIAIETVPKDTEKKKRSGGLWLEEAVPDKIKRRCTG